MKTLTDELMNIVLKGATCINTMESIKTGHITLIFRMPKGERVYDCYNENKYEYIIAQNNKNNLNEFKIIGWKNGTKRQVIKRVYDEELQFTYNE